MRLPLTLLFPCSIIGFFFLFGVLLFLFMGYTFTGLGVFFFFLFMLLLATFLVIGIGGVFFPPYVLS